MDILNDIMILGNTDTWVLLVFGTLLSFLPFATLGFLFSKHRDEEPSYIISLDRIKGLKNAWTLLVLIIVPFIFIINVFVWAGYAFYVIAQFTAWLIKTIYDIIVENIIIPIINFVIKPIWEFIKTVFPLWKIVKWIVSSFIWLFWNIFWMPVKIIFKSIYHYCLIWVWDLYKTSFNSIKGTYKKSRLTATFTGAFYALVILGISIYLSILTGYEVIGFLGLLIATLPSIKAYGVVTSMSDSNDRNHNEHGTKVMHTALNYVIASIVAVVVIELLLLLSWIPDLGLVFLGIAINTNVFLSAIVILSLIVLFFAQSVFPNHLLHNDESTSMQDSVLNYLTAIKEKGLQLVLATIPGAIWIALVLIIPAALIFISVAASDSLKNQVLEDRAVSIVEDNSEAEQDLDNVLNNFTVETISDVEDAFETAIELNVRAHQNNFGLEFPNNVIENPEIILNKYQTDYTAELPKMLKGAIDDTVDISNQIKKTDKLIKRISKHIKQYESRKYKFKVQRKEKGQTKKSDWITISSTDDVTSFVDMNIVEGKSYVYRVKASNKNGDSDYSSEFDHRTFKRNINSPSNLRISSEYNLRLVFAWNDNSTGEDGFVIERKLSSEKNDNWSEYGSVGSDITQYVVSDVRSKHVEKYDYRVLAKGLGDISKPSATRSYQLKLNSPYSITKEQSNLKSTLIDWAYNFGYDTDRWSWKKFTKNKGEVTANITDGVLGNEEKSLAQIMQDKINKETEKLEKLNEDLVFGKDKVSMFEGLVKYDESQITMLRFFKNLAMLFAILFTALFGGMLLSVAMSYLASLFYNAFKIRSKEPVYIMSLINEEKVKDKNQPLLAFSIWFILILSTFAGSFISQL
jgi:hypothetical protein